MTLVREVVTRKLPIARFEPVIGTERYARLTAGGTRVREMLGARTFWNVSSTAVGGGVAEMLHQLVGYADGYDIPVRWLVIGGDPPFFEITKRLHNQLHGSIGDAGPVTGADARHYEQVLAGNADELLGLVSRGDVVVLHDPQTAGLAPRLSSAGALVAWRCHIGVDVQTEATLSAWEFLRPYLGRAQAFVFTRRQYAPPWLPPEQTWIIPPSIDPFSTKNADLDARSIQAILATIGVQAGNAAGRGSFTRSDGTLGEVTRPALVTADGPARPGPKDQVVVQVSRWDRLKDMAGVMRGFADHVAGLEAAYLMLVGPAVSGVADDPEGAAVYTECQEQWKALPAEARTRVLLVTLPLDDYDENAAMVNAIQRRATVIVQKSLAEGFGLTVAEGMWKGRPVIGSAVGGIVDQITPDTGILLADPTDLATFGARLRWLLGNPDEAERMGKAGKEFTRENYIGDVHLLRYADLVEAMLAG